MLTIDLGTIEYFDSETNEFSHEHGGIVRFEYSLKAVYEWEGKWQKPFLKGELTYIELLDLYKFMALDKYDEKFMTDEVVKLISEYMQAKNTATTFADIQSKTHGSTGGKVSTSEEIYALMFSAGVDLDFENRNLNRLLAILKIISLRNGTPQKMSKQETVKQNSNLNKQRRSQMQSKG